MLKKIEKLIEITTVLFMVGLVLIICLQVVSRMLNHPFIWTEELSRFVLVYITFLGAALAYYKGHGLRITMLIDRFSPTMQKVNHVIMLFISLVMIVCLIYISFHLAIESWGSITTALRWNKGIVILVLPVGFSLILIKLMKDVKQILVVTRN